LRQGIFKVAFKLKLALFAFSLHALGANLGFLAINFFGLNVDCKFSFGSDV